MAITAKFNGVFEAPPSIPKLRRVEKTARKSTITCFFGKEKDEFEDNKVHTTRRLAIGLASIALFGNTSIRVSLAEDNGFWLTGPLPVPSVNNKINNEETGTRSFLKKGIYIANIGTKGRMHRLKRYAFDLIALGDMIGQDTWNYIRKYLRLKSTFMYYDFDEVISAAPADDKKSLTELANRLFNNVEKLEDAVKKQNLPQTESYYADTTSILQEVMNRMA
ncbi:photosynthetic NDH subunit of lumenal location 3, chloroplastic-like [Olea europaea var. sylvestris]|uniref:photosynthetic NDH subunit of lumenal location 3, chloroplastic-like n=1 Tax=Olea europaea var. sylvestris TaxID=158386 RepID=UPI000C1D0915|nr:photosynthetic NDH subunit of lumenal location 3, chloroplastic-like [Olea europaea var. sylvestris]